MKRFFTVLLALTLVLSAVSAAFAETAEAKRLPLVRVAISDDVATLDPLAGNEQGRFMVLQSFVEYLCTLDGVGGNMEGLIAKSWEKPDPYTIRATIYDYVYDSAGNHITAKDVAFSYNKCIELGLNAASVNMIASVTAVEDYVVEFKVNTTAAGCMLNTLTGCPIVSEAAYEADPDHMANKPVGSGAYIVTEFIPGSTVKMVRNEKYWQKPELTSWYSKANVDAIEFQVVMEPAQLALALETGTVDIAGYLPQNEANSFDGNPEFTVTAQTNMMSQVVLFNCNEDNPFAKKELRQAVCYAISNEAMLKNVYSDKGSVNKSYGNDTYGDFLAKWNDEEYYDYNPEMAKAKLAEAGYAPGQLHVKIMTATNPNHIRLAELMQAFIAQIGITSEIVSFDGALYNPYRFDPTQWDIRIDNKGAGDYITSVFKYSFDQDMFGGRTQNFYQDAALQDLLRTAMAEETHTPENIDAFHQALKELAVGYGICTDNVNYVSNANVVKSLTFNWFQKALPGACEYIVK